ncbi:tyrosine-type recombinase/integrase [Tropicibacter oceani]|uniref:Integrase arm-type DNA-binding domain-containing protein n=1 Tax=Tropicibacter oceani TaxID=3058420 RepID=A0ABY8QE98_9RHOB|nr:site-specific integrase [Tropicibacter oceani]WGW02328.1 integrase arm-type DNA-binding domain-containing protein [Tropicibacter oceani]
MARNVTARRPEKALTAQRVRNATEPGKYFDGNGLYLLVKPNGSRSWVQRIVIRGKRREMGLGSAALVTLAEAREAALQNRKVARSGGDPIQAKQEALAVLTFEEAARKVHEMHRPTWSNAKHAAQFLTTLETYAFPHIGPVKVGEVNTSDVLRVLTPIWTDKPETARRVRQRIGMVMKWAVAKGWRQDNPAEAISQALPKHDRRKVHRKALPYAEVPGFLRAVQASKAGAVTKLAIEFLILTAARSGEVRGAVWSEIDLSAAVWTVPAERMKAKREHRVPLSPRAVAILQAAQSLSDGSDLVFPGAKRGRPLWDATMSKLARELGFDVDIHGFRTSFRMWAQEKTDSPREVAEAALAHTIRNQAEAAYARSDLFKKRRGLMELWAEAAAMVNNL